jgi:L-malate glycosyltransferase
MRLLITSFTYAPQVNGVAETVRAHAEGLSQLGHEVTVATGFAAERRVGPCGDNPSIVQFKVSGDARLGCSGDVDGYGNFLRQWRGDVILCHCWQIWSTDLALDVLAGHPAKKVMVSHGFSAHRYPLGSIFPRGLRTWLGWRNYVRQLPQHLRLFDHVVFLAPLANPGPYYDRRVALRERLSKISDIPTGVSLTHFDRDLPDFRGSHGLGSAPMVLCVANFDPFKNQALALRAFTQAAVPGAVLVFIGAAENNYSVRLRTWAAEADRLPNGRRVIFLAGVDRTETLAAFRAADLFLCPSRWESGPLVLLEAMASRTAFIATNVGFASLLPGGRVAADERSMAVAIRELLADDHQRERLADAGRVACERIYNWPAIVRRYDELCRRLGDERSQ